MIGRCGGRAQRPGRAVPDRRQDPPGAGPPRGEAYRKELWQLVKDLRPGAARRVRRRVPDPGARSSTICSPATSTSRPTWIRSRSPAAPWPTRSGPARRSSRRPTCTRSRCWPTNAGCWSPFAIRASWPRPTLRILGDPALKQRLERNAYAYGRETAWPRVGERMLAVLRSAIVQPAPARPGAARVSCRSRGVRPPGLSGLRRADPRRGARRPWPLGRSACTLNRRRTTLRLHPCRARRSEQGFEGVACVDDAARAVVFYCECGAAGGPRRPARRPSGCCASSPTCRMTTAAFRISSSIGPAAADRAGLYL